MTTKFTIGRRALLGGAAGAAALQSTKWSIHQTFRRFHDDISASNASSTRLT